MLLPRSRRMWLSKFRPARDRRGRQRPQRRLAVRSLEFLEDRTVLSSITPTTFADGTGIGSLRDAIAAANAPSGPTVIRLGSGTYLLTSGELEIAATAHQVTIDGQGSSGPNATVIDANLWIGFSRWTRAPR